MKELTKAPSREGRDYALLVDLPILLIAAAVIGVVYIFTQADRTLLFQLSNGLPPILAFVAFAMAAPGLTRNGVRKGDRISTVWFGYSIGILFWFLGETTWAIYALWGAELRGKFWYD
jgi:dolichol kinase